MDADIAIAPKYDGSKVAGLEVVNADKLHHRVTKLIDGETGIDAINLGGVHKTADMLAEAENCGPGDGFITADSFKHRATVTDNVGKNVDLGIVPVNEAAVVPDLLSRR
jgi:hypothetical protein